MSYDRTVFLELFNGPDVYIRDLKSCKSRLSNPRLNLTLAGHVETTYKQMSDEREFDGLLHRFLLCSPCPLFDISSKNMREADAPTVSLLCILYSISYLCESGKTLQYDPEALNEMDKLIDSYRDVIKHANNIDQFMA